MDSFSRRAKLSLLASLLAISCLFAMPPEDAGAAPDADALPEGKITAIRGAQPE